MLASGVSIDEMTRIASKGLVFRYLTKPWMTNDMKVAILNASERYCLRKEIEAQENRIQTLTDKLQVAEQSVTQANANLAPLTKSAMPHPARPGPPSHEWLCHFLVTRKTLPSPR